MVTTAVNALSVFVGVLKPSDADAHIFISIEEVDTEKYVSYRIRNMLDFQCQGVLFPQG